MQLDRIIETHQPHQQERGDGWNGNTHIRLIPPRLNGYSLEVLRLCKITDGAPGPEMENGNIWNVLLLFCNPHWRIVWAGLWYKWPKKTWTMCSAARWRQVQAAALFCPQLTCLSQGLKVPHIASVCQIKPLLSMSFCTILAHRG